MDLKPVKMVYAGSTKRYAKFEPVGGEYAGTLYVQLEDWRHAGSPETLTVTLTSQPA